MEHGGNAVVALRQRIDLGHMGVIFRALGTAIVVERIGAEQPGPDGNDFTTATGTVSPAGGKRKVSALETVPGSPVDVLPGTVKVEDTHSGR